MKKGEDHWGRFLIVLGKDQSPVPMICNTVRNATYPDTSGEHAVASR